LLSGRPPIPDEWMPQQQGARSSRGGSSNVTSPKRGRGAGGYSPQKEFKPRNKEDRYQVRAQEELYLEEMQRQKQKRKQKKGYQIHFLI
jgi:hypothetical protein